ncbi:FixG Ig-like domain-containing protein, partial [Klebsiella pneumoniae]
KQIEKKLPPGMSAEYKVKITNKSSQTDQYTIEIPADMQESVTVDEPSGEIKTGETKLVTFTVKVREDEEIGDEQEMTIPIASRLQFD